MHTVFGLVLIVHLVGMSAILGSWLAAFRAPRVLPGMVHGALTQLVTGVILVGLLEAGAGDDDAHVDYPKIGVKLAIALVVTVLSWVNRKRDDAVPPGVVHAIGALALVNVAVAVLWS